jgi:anti-sigma regulatory factor (Ser/Thr protein kinase)
MAEVTGSDAHCMAIRGPADVEAARRLVVALAGRLGFTRRAAEELALVVTELGTNIVHYAGDGVIEARTVTRATGVGLEVKATDRGPGIADIPSARTDGFSTGGGLGLGLGLVERLSDEFTIESGSWGTRMSAVRWRS